MDLRYNSNLFEFNCRNNLLTSLDIRNGNNLALWYFTSLNNDSLMCINVDDVAYANYAWEKDNHSTFSDNCNPTGNNQFIYSNSIKKKVIKIPYFIAYGIGLIFDFISLINFYRSNWIGSLPYRRKKLFL